MNSETKSFHIVTFFMGILSFLILGIIASSVAKRNGLIEGLIASLIIIIIVFLIHLIWKIEIDAKLFIKGTIYILSSCIGGIIGINLIPKNKLTTVDNWKRARA